MNGCHLNDEDFIEQFETCALPAEAFHHQDHVRLAWLYLRRYPLIDALVRFSEGLKRFAIANGKANLYHETITLAYVFLIQERLKRCGIEQSWQAFAEANADLLDWQNRIQKTYYSEETLRSDFARTVFVLPDKFTSLS
jgi:hypothetical protein